MTDSSNVKTVNGHVYNYVKQEKDERDLKFDAIMAADVLPSLYDLRPKMPPVYDQGQLGSCVSNGTAALVEYLLMKEKKPVFMPARLEIYYDARLLEGSPIDQDTGCQVRTGLKAVKLYGTCSESLWPYDITKFAVKPSAQVYAESAKHKQIKYMAVQQSEHAIKSALQTSPVVFGISVYDSFESQDVADTGMVPMPNTDVENNIGGHCIVIVGWDDSKQVFIVRNSWSSSWGDNGYCYMPYQYVLNPDLASDFWCASFIN